MFSHNKHRNGKGKGGLFVWTSPADTRLINKIAAAF